MPQPLTPSEDKQELIDAPLQNPAASAEELSSTTSNSDALKPLALPDLLFTQNPVWLGLIAQLIGGALPEDIAAFTRRAILLRPPLRRCILDRRFYSIFKPADLLHFHTGADKGELESALDQKNAPFTLVTVYV